MKKLFFVSAMTLCIGLASCDDPAKTLITVTRTSDGKYSVMG